MLVEVRVQSLGMDKVNEIPVVILQEVDGERILPIWIGPGEASAIAMQLAELEFARPLTHDLLVSVLGGLGGALHRVVITKVENETYYAELIIHRNGDVISVDARPSDSIAVALRMNATILADEELLDRAGVELTEGETWKKVEAGPEPETIIDAEELEKRLKRMNPEDFGRFKP